VANSRNFNKPQEKLSVLVEALKLENIPSFFPHYISKEPFCESESQMTKFSITNTNLHLGQHRRVFLSDYKQVADSYFLSQIEFVATLR